MFPSAIALLCPPPLPLCPSSQPHTLFNRCVSLQFAQLLRVHIWSPLVCSWPLHTNNYMFAACREFRPLLAAAHLMTLSGHSVVGCCHPNCLCAAHTRTRCMRGHSSTFMYGEYCSGIVRHMHVNIPLMMTLLAIIIANYYSNHDHVDTND